LGIIHLSNDKSVTGDFAVNIGHYIYGMSNYPVELRELFFTPLNKDPKMNQSVFHSSCHSEVFVVVAHLVLIRDLTGLEIHLLRQTFSVKQVFRTVILSNYLFIIAWDANSRWVPVEDEDKHGSN